MPVTPYHFGPNGLVGLLFKRWIDLPVVVLANVVIDMEVLFALFLCALLVYGFLTPPLRGAEKIGKK